MNIVTQIANAELRELAVRRRADDRRRHLQTAIDDISNLLVDLDLLVVDVDPRNPEVQDALADEHHEPPAHRDIAKRILGLRRTLAGALRDLRRATDE